MISLSDHANDSISSRGIEHFFSKYGIPTTKGKTGSKVNIIYGKQKAKTKGFSIFVSRNEVGDSIKGWIETNGFRVPVFETPQETPGGKGTATFRARNKRYACVACGDDEVTIGFDAFREIGLILTGSMEKTWKGLTGNEKRRIAAIPVLDCYEKMLFDAILYACKKTRTPLVRKDSWPDGKGFAVCLTHDVDEIRKSYQYITKPIKLAKKRDLRGLAGQASSFKQKMFGREPYWTFEDLIETEERLGVRSTLFFLKETADVRLAQPKTWKHHGRRYDFRHDRVSGMIRRLQAGGWEVGLHGSYDSYNDLKKLEAEKRELEAVLGSRVKGNRQHNLRMDIPKTWLYHERIGLEYDTSLGLSDCIGFRWGTASPFHPTNPANSKSMNVLEIPLSVMDITLFSMKDSREELLKIQEEVERHSGVLTLLWHHTVFNDREHPGWSRLYEEAVGRARERNAWIATAKDISEWWRAREKSRVSYVFKNGMIKIKAVPKGRAHFLKIHVPFKSISRPATTGCELVETNMEERTITVKTRGSSEISIGV